MRLNHRQVALVALCAGPSAQVRANHVRAAFALIVVGSLCAVAACSATTSAHLPGASGRTPGASSASQSAGPGGPTVRARTGLDTRLVGKFSANPIVFSSLDIGVVSVSGFVRSSTVVSSWQERTTDGGRHWRAGPVRHTGDGRYPTPVVSTQVGSVFTSSADGWAYGPSLFFTTDGGVSWHAETRRPLSVGSVAVARTSTWVAVNRCRYNCPSRLYQASHVGGPLTLLPGQPTRDELIDDLHRPSAATAWAVIEDNHGRQQLTTTTDAGRSWQLRRVPCTAADTFQVSGIRPYGRATNRGRLGAGVVRSTNGGRSWHQVLTSAPDRELAIESFVADGTRHAWLVSMTSSDRHGIGFTVYSTSNGGRTWTSSNLPIPKSLLTG